MDLSPFKVVRLNAEQFPVAPFEQQMYDEHGITPELVEVNSEQDVLAATADADAVMVVSQSLSDRVVSGMVPCRVICRLGAGMDKIDVETATRCGIVVANVPDFCFEEQADHAFALLLAVARKLNEMRHCMLQARFREGREQSRPLRRLPGRTIGLVGFGGSAKAMARRAAGFGMRILVTRKNMTANDPVADSLGVQMVPLRELLAESDFVSLHLPLNEDTRHLLDAVRLRLMKPGSVLINTARGAIVDEDALADVLEEGHLSGAGLDTFAVVDVHNPEPQPPEHRLFQMERVVFTPHVAAFSVDSSREVGIGSVENLVAVLSGQWPRPGRIVNPDVVPRVVLQAASEPG